MKGGGRSSASDRRRWTYAAGRKSPAALSPQGITYYVTLRFGKVYKVEAAYAGPAARAVATSAMSKSRRIGSINQSGVEDVRKKRSVVASVAWRC